MSKIDSITLNEEEMCKLLGGDEMDLDVSSSSMDSGADSLDAEKGTQKPLRCLERQGQKCLNPQGIPCAVPLDRPCSSVPPPMPVHTKRECFVKNNFYLLIVAVLPFNKDCFFCCKK